VENRVEENGASKTR